MEASDVAGAFLIPIKLVGAKNYFIWSRSMKIALLGKRKHDLMNGTCRKDAYREELHEQ